PGAVPELSCAIMSWAMIGAAASIAPARSGTIQKGFIAISRVRPDEKPSHQPKGSSHAVVSSFDLMVYLKLSASRQSSRVLPVSPCGYIRNATFGPFEPGSTRSWAKLYASQLPSQAPNKVLRAAATF